MKRAVLLFAFLIGASSCSSCESCKGSSKTADASGEAASTPTATASATTTAPPTATTSAAPMEANYACRMVARAITSKACDCPQKNNAGCCFYGTPPVKPGAAPPYLECSRGKTDWPASVESRFCKVAMDEKRKELLAACFAAKEKLRCGKTGQGDLGADVPNECETLLKEMLSAK